MVIPWWRAQREHEKRICSRRDLDEPMANIQQATLENRLLSRLPATDFALIADRLEPEDCTLSKVLVAPDTVMPYVYFLERGLASIVVVSAGGIAVEGGIVGREGFVAPSVALGADMIPHRIETQIAGMAYRIPRTDLLSAAATSATLNEVLLRFAQVMAVQSAYTVLSNAIQSVDQRLARWLLMSHDRSDSDDLLLTHRFLSVMLAVRRASVTDAIHILEARGLIGAERKYITIRDRSGLEAFAGAAYGTPETEYRRLMGPL